jgi:hypothetical protein
MRTAGLCLLAGAVGCATVQPFALSQGQRADFDEVVRKAEAAGALEGPPEATARLADAKSEFEYAQHIPLYPDRARSLVVKARTDGELALALALQRRADQTLFARAAAQVEAATAPAGAPAGPAATPAVAAARPVAETPTSSAPTGN